MHASVSIQPVEINEESSEPLFICPRCGSEAYNKYGRIGSGKQRFICLVCGRQFVEGVARFEPGFRPQCPTCGSDMHVYMRTEAYIRFRCGRYPVCRTFEKIITEE